MTRTEILEYVKKEYGTTPEYLWKSYPQHAVLRHSENKKWFGIVMSVSKKSLGIQDDIYEDDYVEVLNVKCDADGIAFFRQMEGILPGYHMNKAHWISVLIHSVSDELIRNLLEISYNLTMSKKTVSKTNKLHNTKWIIPANPKFYDVEAAFAKDDVIIWKQSNDIWVGDIIYLYLAAPFSAIRYKCRAVEVNIPYQYTDENLTLKKAMRIQKLQVYDSDPIDFSMLNEFGVFAVRGPRSMPNSLEEEIKHRYPQ